VAGILVKVASAGQGGYEIDPSIRIPLFHSVLKGEYMRKLLFIALCSVPLLSFAQSSTYSANSGNVYLYDSGFVTTNTAVSTGIFDATQLDYLQVQFTTPTGATRSLIPECLSAAGTTIYSFPTTSVAAAASVQLVFDPRVTTTTNAPSGTTFYSTKPCSRMRIGAASVAGTAIMRVSGRSLR
jgi:hypothetical protein